jgi:glyceraldehyde-3-phosphate dehydrogenase (ferredoxin)
MGSLYDCKEQFLRAIDVLASRLHSRNCPVFWESERNIDYLHTFLHRKQAIDGDPSPELAAWLGKIARDKMEAAREFWYETLKGVDESLQEFF